MKTWRTSPGRMAETVSELPHPERCAYQSSGIIGENVTIKEWPARVAMARTIRMQEKRSPHSMDWRPLHAHRLGDGEGY